MNEQKAAKHITEVGRVVVPVSDQDRALDFYRDKLGFETRVDVTYGGDVRWLEVAPRAGGTALALVPPRGGMWESVGIDTRISLTSEDAEADHAGLLADGVDVDVEILRLGPAVPPMFFFRDPDGNTLQVVQAS